MGYEGRKDRDRLNATGTNHGSIECIRGKWYVFYHRNTHKSGYSRQACAEPVEILPDGRIPQVEITSQGFCGPLESNRTYPASICCNLYSGKMPHIGNGVSSAKIPHITCEDGQQIVVATNRARIVYKYFHLAAGEYVLILRYKTSGRAKITVLGEHGEIPTLIKPSRTWMEMEIPCRFQSGIQPLILRYHGSKELSIQSICL